MAIDEKGSAGQKARVHAHAFAAVDSDEHEALPLFAFALDFRFKFLEKAFFEFQDFSYIHARNEGMSGCDGSVGEENVLEIVVAGRNDGGALVDLSGIEQIQNGEMLNRQDSIHAFETKATLAVQEIGDVSLFESGLLSQTAAGQISFIDAI